MADFNVKTKRDDEIEKLATMLRRSRLANSDSDARRMAADMLETSKKVSDDFSEREKKMFGDQRKDAEVELAHKQVEQLTSNLARGRGDVRINVEGIDVNKPLKELIPDEPEREEAEDEDGVELKNEPSEADERIDASEESVSVDEGAEEPVEEAASQEEKVEVPIPEELGTDSIKNMDEGVEGEGVEEQDADVADDVAAEPEAVDEASHDEVSPEEPVENNAEGAESPEVEEEPADATEADEPCDDEEGAEGEPDFSVKELNTKEQLQKSDDERKKEREKMPEAKVDLNNMFNVNK
jgi:hypothetical protein